MKTRQIFVKTSFIVVNSLIACFLCLDFVFFESFVHIKVKN